MVHIARGDVVSKDASPLEDRASGSLISLSVCILRVFNTLWRQLPGGGEGGVFHFCEEFISL